MKWSRRYLWIVLLLVAIPAFYYGMVKWQIWNNYSRPVVWQNWAIALSKGGSVTYRNQSPRMRVAGPADTEKLLIWVRPDGQTQEYPISSIGGAYTDIEFRIRQDGKGLFLISWDWKKIIATLDLSSGRFTGDDGTVYDWGADGQNESAQPGHPKWARFNAGRSLGLRKFQ